MKTVTVLDGQSIFDIAVQKCGSAESAFDISLLNGISLTDVIAGGTVLQLPSVKNADNVSVFETGNINPATALTANDIANTIEGEGIGYWSIENDFIVS